jgi:hypothetical protein
MTPVANFGSEKFYNASSVCDPTSIINNRDLEQRVVFVLIRDGEDNFRAVRL